MLFKGKKHFRVSHIKDELSKAGEGIWGGGSNVKIQKEKK